MIGETRTTRWLVYNVNLKREPRNLLYDGPRKASAVTRAEQSTEQGERVLIEELLGSQVIARTHL